jgi:preprotein translocase subunit SecY
LRKEGGAAGRHALTRYTRYLTVVLAAFQAIGVSIALQSQTVGSTSVVIAPGIGFLMTATVTLVAGTMFLVWLGEQVTERGIGNGISMLIFAGIVAGLPQAVGGTLELARTGELHVVLVLFLLALTILVTGLVVFVERGQTSNYRQLRQAPARSAGLCGSNHAFTAEVEYVRGHSADLCFQPDPVSCHTWKLVR